MKRKRILRWVAITGLAGILLATGTVIYMFNMPHRDVQSANTDYSLSSSEIVQEYLEDPDAANKKYLAADGNSKILEITGEVAKISEDFNGQKVILLKSEGEKAGVSATFTDGTGKSLESIRRGQEVTVKGVIRSGAFYDEDLDMYVNVVIEKSDIIR
jgi:hypothetical protein